MNIFLNELYKEMINNNIIRMKNSEIVNKFHNFVIVYIVLGWLFKSQRIFMIFLLPTIQFQFLVNENNCVLTQLEKKLLIEEQKEEIKKEDKKEEEIVYDSFVGTKLKEWNIELKPKHREYLIHSAVYGSFLLSYFL